MVRTYFLCRFCMAKMETDLGIGKDILSLQTKYDYDGDWSDMAKTLLRCRLINGRDWFKNGELK